MITRTHNAYHLGDNLVHLNFLRKVAIANPDRQFVHAAQWQYLKQLQDVISDIPNVELKDFNYTTPSDSINAWRGDKQFWYSHPDRLDFVKFHVEAWFPFLADRMNVENPIKCAKDMLFDYTALAIVANPKVSKFVLPFDILFVNSQPGSGQWLPFNPRELQRLAIDLSDRWQTVTTARMDTRFYGGVCTEDYGLSVTDIGNLSMYCHTILMVSTGPSWTTFNVWNQDSVKNRIILLEPERVNLGPNTMHCSTVDEAAEVLKGAGLL
jgi:hypothetical protein